MKNKKIAVFGGPVPQRLDAVMNLVPTGSGRMANAIATALSRHFDRVERIGNMDGVKRCDFAAMEDAVERVDADVIVFLPHLPNVLVEPIDGKLRAEDLRDGRVRLGFRPTPKLLLRIKRLHPETLLIPFKIADPETTKADLIRFMLQAHAALMVYSTLGESGNYRIMDVFGNEIPADRAELPDRLSDEIVRLTKAVRRRSVHTGSLLPAVPHLAAFVRFSRDMRPAFTQIVERNVGTGRWPGNFSFRCTHGFMSARHDGGFVITRRNVEKTGLTEQDFVSVDGALRDGKLSFSGAPDAKPSIDAPVHRVIYEHLPWVRALVHGHLFCVGDTVYPESLERWPCGAENEGYDIASKAPKERRDLWIVNVDGHGFVALIGSDAVEEGLNRLRAMRFEANRREM